MTPRGQKKWKATAAAAITPRYLNFSLVLRPLSFLEERAEEESVRYWDWDWDWDWRRWRRDRDEDEERDRERERERERDWRPWRGMAG